MNNSFLEFLKKHFKVEECQNGLYKIIENGNTHYVLSGNNTSEVFHTMKNTSEDNKEGFPRIGNEGAVGSSDLNPPSINDPIVTGNRPRGMFVGEDEIKDILRRQKEMDSRKKNDERNPFIRRDVKPFPNYPDPNNPDPDHERHFDEDKHPFI